MTSPRVSAPALELPGGPDESGKHRRPEPDPLPDVDVAGRLRSGPVVPSGTRDGGPGDGARPPPAGPRLRGPTAGAAAAAPGPTVVVRRDRHAERAARRARPTPACAGRRGRGRRRGARRPGRRGCCSPLGRPSRRPPPRSGDKQQTLLVQVTGTDGTAAASALVGITQGAASAVALLVPSRLSSTSPAPGNLPFGETTTVGDPDGVQRGADRPARAARRRHLDADAAGAGRPGRRGRRRAGRRRRRRRRHRRRTATRRSSSRPATSS